MQTDGHRERDRVWTDRQAGMKADRLRQKGIRGDGETIRKGQRKTVKQKQRHADRNN